ncbi:PD-(D/E)XK motif protein [Ruegeria sp. R14_0]|uniref:PD-(D/E)XK motif protein n=1 Tax=Ruegeria sp. R14_0 TaxID=2821100 RepID=UPI001ADAF118|nr:PD-(D/E)XK motif protein [Ruegeria sp. R14_0]MBO9445735.1 PD-(D/E)XK motif protein [Ruegeria sp. R14_0]
MKTMIRRQLLKPRNPWERLDPDEAKRVDLEGRFDFFWVVLEAGMPGLMLKLPSLPRPLPRLPKLKNLIASFRTVSGGSAFVLGLKERSQVEIFETLCRDVVEAGEAGADRDEALFRALQRTRRWYHLLRGGKTSGLSVEEQRGLVGELAFLRELVSNLGPETAIEAWTGPTGSAKDFELIGSCVEVKTRRAAAKPFVAISSEDQLADVEGSRLFLRVVNVASAVLPEGQSLHDHVQLTAEMFERDGAAFEAWEETLYSTGYDPENGYDDRRWLLGTAADYEVTEGFPRISTPLLPGVENVRYSLGLDACEPFRLEVDLVEVIQRGLEHE